MANSTRTLEPLSQSGNEIRLVKLSPRSERGGATSTTPTPDPLSVANPSLSLFKASLDESPEYKALSYVWGSATDTVTVTVNGAAFQATRNLTAALQHLQDESEPVILWIDALCINQSDNDEKSWQILLMKRIYESAQTTVIWLGPDADDSDLAMKMLIDKSTGMSQQKKAEEWWDLTAEGQEKATSQYLQGLEGGEPVDQTVARATSSSAQQELGALEKLLDREYWFRVWCLQEFAVSSKGLIMCGAFNMDADDFARLATNTLVGNYMDTKRIVSSVDLTTLDTREGGASALRPGNVVHGATRMFGQRRWYRKGVEDAERLKLLPLLDLLDFAYTKQGIDISFRATDPKDLVYGLLNIAGDVESLGIEVNYGKSCEEIYTEVWIALLRHGHAGYLGLAQSQRLSGDPANTLPSWVPDWRMPKAFHVQGSLDFGEPFNACDKEHEATEWVETGDMNILGVKGVQVDLVYKTGTTLADLKELTQLGFGPAASYLEEIQDFVSEASDLRPAESWHSQEHLTQAVWRVPVADHEVMGTFDDRMRRVTAASQQGCASVKAIADAFAKVQAGMETGDISAMQDFTAAVTTHIDDVGPYLQVLGLQCGRRPFLTSVGLVGIGPGPMQPGDVVAILYGAPVPYVLRPVEGGSHLLLGEAYVDGIMDGEFFMRKRKERVFQLR